MSALYYDESCDDFVKWRPGSTMRWPTHVLSNTGDPRVPVAVLRCEFSTELWPITRDEKDGSLWARGRKALLVSTGSHGTRWYCWESERRVEYPLPPAK